MDLFGRNFLESDSLTGKMSNLELCITGVLSGLLVLLAWPLREDKVFICMPMKLEFSSWNSRGLAQPTYLVIVPGPW